MTAPRGFSRRAAVLAGLLLVVGITVAPFLRDAANQQSEMSALREEVATREKNVADLEQQLARWDDPAFVKAQARQRLKYVMPGEVGYLVLDEGEQKAEPTTPTDVAAQQVSTSTRPWFGTLWQSVQEAGDPERPADGASVPGQETDPKPAPEP